jgi:flagellar biosynthesis chaperone FliJ
MRSANSLIALMLPEELRNQAREAAGQLDRATGFWSGSIGARLRSIADYNDEQIRDHIRRNLSIADYNHIQSRVNFLNSLIQSWSEAEELYAPKIVDDLGRDLEDARAQQSTIIKLIQFGWGAS